MGVTPDLMSLELLSCVVVGGTHFDRDGLVVGGRGTAGRR